jgi:dTMP kinase
VLIDLDLNTGIERTRTRNAAGTTSETRLDEESAEFHRRVREAYLTIARQHAERFRVIDGRGTPEDVALKVWKEVAPHV